MRHSSSQKPKVKAFVEYINNETESALSRRRYLAPVIPSLIAGFMGAWPYYAGGIELAGSNEAEQVLYPMASMVSNFLLYFMFGFTLTRLFVEFISTPESMRQLMPRQVNSIIIGVAVLFLAMIAGWSAVPYLALAQMTDQPLYAEIDAVLVNSIAHGVAFEMALTTPNIVFHRHIWELLRRAVMQCVSSKGAIEEYEREIKNQFIQSELHEIILKNLKAAISGNHNKAEFNELLQNYEQVPSSEHKAVAIGRWITGMSFCASTIISLSGYLASAYLALKNDSGTRVRGVIGMTLANTTFLYLVMRSVYNVATTQIYDLFVNTYKKGFIETLNSASWFAMHKGLALGMLPFIIFNGVFSYPASIYLIDKSFKSIDWLNKHINFVKDVTYPSAGIFNMIGSKDFIEFLSVTAQIIKDAIGYIAKESKPLLEAGRSEYEINRDKLYWEVKSAEINRILARIPEKELLAFFRDYLDTEVEAENQDQLIQIFTDGKVNDLEEFEDFINNGQVPAEYEDTSPYYMGRNVIVSTVKSGFFAVKTKVEECLPCNNSRYALPTN